MKLEVIGWAFSEQCLRGALLVSLVSAWALVGLFYYLNRKREARGIEEEVEAIRQEQFKLITTKEACLHLYNRMRAVEDKEIAMAELRRAHLLAAEREQLEALSRMAGDVAHDLNNALTPITAYSELLLSSLPNLADLPRQRLQKISDAAEDVARIVAHMREFYRPGETRVAAVDSSQPKLDPDLPSSRGACRPLRILCIDDEPQLRQVLHDVLESEHHQVTVAPSGEAGLELFRAHLHHGQPYEVVMTDLGMPGIDGRQVARAIKADSPRTPIIMLTGWGTMTDGQSTLDVDAVLGKPPRKQELSNLLCQITERNG